MNDCAIDEILKFDSTKPMASIQIQIIVSLSIVIFSNLAFSIILKLFMSDDFISKVEKDQGLELSRIKNKGISLRLLTLGEIVNGSIHAPISEELFFRFLLFKILFVNKMNINPHIANFLQASIFGGLHMTNSIYSEQKLNISLAQSISSFITGVLCGYSYYYTNSILPSTFAHIINNLISSCNQIYDYKKL
jgi:membrane protease YdiL (CAAX protease family)